MQNGSRNGPVRTQPHANPPPTPSDTRFFIWDFRPLFLSLPLSGKHISSLPASLLALHSGAPVAIAYAQSKIEIQLVISDLHE